MHVLRDHLPRRRALRVYTLKDSLPAVHPSNVAHGGERRPEAAVRHGVTGRRVGRSVGTVRGGRAGGLHYQ